MNRLVFQKLRGLNLLATYRLGRRCGRLDGLLCYGRVQLTLAPGAVVRVSSLRSRIGEPIQGVFTPKRETTVLNIEGELALDGSRIGRGTAIQVAKGASLSIGPGSFLNDRSRVMTRSAITIGRDCAIAWGVTILDDDGHGSGLPPYSRPIVIEDRCWVGCNATILKGVTIGAGSVVGAGAVVTRSCPASSLLVGVPARVVRTGVSWTDVARSSPGTA